MEAHQIFDEGRQNYRAGAYLDAYQHLEEARRHRYANRSELPFLHAATLYQLSRTSEALDEFRAGLDGAYDKADQHNAIGACLLSLGDFDGAVGEFNEAIRIKPNRAMYRRNLYRARDLRMRVQSTITLTHTDHNYDDLLWEHWIPEITD